MPKTAVHILIFFLILFFQTNKTYIRHVSADQPNNNQTHTAEAQNNSLSEWLTTHSLHVAGNIILLILLGLFIRTRLKRKVKD